MKRRKQFFNGLPYDLYQYEEACSKIINFAAQHDPSCGDLSIVVTPNVQHFYMYEHDKNFRSALDNSFMSLLDGMPLVWLARDENPDHDVEKISGSDIFEDLLDLAHEKDLRVMIVGGQPRAAEIVAEKYTEKHDKEIILAYCPPFGFNKDENKNNNVIKKINEFKPHLLLIGLGSPKQELWLHKHREELCVNVAIGIGASIDFTAGFVERAPLWMQKAGLEWFYRLIVEPRRLFKRYFVTNIHFLKSVTKHKVKKSYK